MSKRLNRLRDAIVHEVDFIIAELPPSEEDLAGWTLLQKTLLKLGADVEDVVQTIKESREGVSVDHTT